MANIMIADDAVFMRRVLRNLLTEMGHTVVVEAANGQEAVDLYRKTRPDMVTMDITMPVMDGMQALKEIMEYDPFANVIMVSAMGQRHFVVEAIKMGAKDFLVKPFERPRVEAAVQKVVG